MIIVIAVRYVPPELFLVLWRSFFGHRFSVGLIVAG